MLLQPDGRREYEIAASVPGLAPAQRPVALEAADEGHIGMRALGVKPSLASKLSPYLTGREIRQSIR